MNEKPEGNDGRDQPGPDADAEAFARRQREALAHVDVSLRLALQRKLQLRSCYGSLRILGVAIQILAAVAGVLFLVQTLMTSSHLQDMGGMSCMAFIMGILTAMIITAVMLALGGVLRWLADMGDVKLEMLLNGLDDRRRMLGVAPRAPSPRPWTAVPEEGVRCPNCQRLVAPGENECLCGWRPPR